VITRDTRFARYSRSFCWLLAAIRFVLGIFLLRGELQSEVLSGILWIAGAVVFFFTGICLPRSSAAVSSEASPADNKRDEGSTPD
jgi:threonine/homoserine/homoserine lactone efflux protein